MTDVVVPAHNEADTIGDVVTAASAAPSVSAVIVVADKCTGLELVTTTDVLFVDGDLVGLQWQHVEGLLRAEPAGGQVAGLRDEPYAWGQRNLPPITGERRLPADLARSVDLAGSGYRAETLLNAAVGRARLPHSNYVLVGVKNPTRITRAPVSWLTMWGDLALIALLNLPGLYAYIAHPDG